MGLASAASFSASASFRGAASASAAASASFFLSLSGELLISEYSSSPPSNLVSLCTRQVEDALSSLRRATTGEAFDDSSGRIPAEAEERFGGLRWCHSCRMRWVGVDEMSG